MFLDLSDILQGRKERLIFDLQFAVKGEKRLDNHAYDHINDIKAKGSVNYRRDELWIQLTYESMVQFVCDRCLDGFDLPVSGEIEREMSVKDEFDVEWLVIEDEKIDLSKVILDDIIVNLPIQLVCSKSCEGLCPTCGINLNHESCHCKDDDIDPRLASLKSLLP